MINQEQVELMVEDSSKSQVAESFSSELTVAVLQRNSDGNQLYYQSSEFVPEETKADSSVSSLVLDERKENSEINYQIISRAEIIKDLTKIGYAMSIGSGLKIVENVALAKFLTEVGNDALAVEGLFDLYMGFLSSSAASFVTTSPTVMIGEAYGRGDKEAVRRIVQQSWIFSLIVSVPVIAGLASAEVVLNAFGQPHELVVVIGEYAKVLYIGTFPLLNLIVDINFLKTVSKQHLLIPIQIVSCGIGIGICYVLVLGKLGFEPMGAIGVGYAIDIQSWISWFICKGYFYFDQELKSYRLFSFSFEDMGPFKKLFWSGLPLFALALSDQGLNFMMGMMIGWLGKEKININQAMNIFLRLINIPGDGFRQAIQVRVSQMVGSKSFFLMKRYQYTGVFLYTAINVTPLLFFVTIPKQLTIFFVPDVDLEEMEVFLRLTFVTRALSNIIQSCSLGIIDNLNTLLDTYYPSIVQILTSLVLTLPLGYLMAFYLDMDLIGLNIATFAGATLSIPLVLRRLSYRNRKVETENVASAIISSTSIPLLASQESSTSILLAQPEPLSLKLASVAEQTLYVTPASESVGIDVKVDGEATNTIVSRIEQLQTEFASDNPLSGIKSSTDPSNSPSIGSLILSRSLDIKPSFEREKLDETINRKNQIDYR